MLLSPTSSQMDRRSLQVRITWAPQEAPLRIDTLSFGDSALSAPVTLQGGAAEFLLPSSYARGPQRLRWQLASAGQSGVDEARVEVCDSDGQWHLLGALLGATQHHRVWINERLLPRTLLARAA